MASKKLLRDYPSLSAYLDYGHENPLMTGMPGSWLLVPGAPVIAAVVAAVAAAITMRFIGGGAFIGPTVLVSALATGVTVNFSAKAAKSKAEREQTPESKLLLKAWHNIELMRSLDQQKRLMKNMDRVAIQLLEAGAYHWGRVHTTFDDRRWDAAELPDHWVSLKRKATAAADLAMAELVNLAVECMGEPAKTRKDDFASVFEDFVDLDIEDALQGLSRVIRSDSGEYRFSSPRTREVFPQGKALAERLKELADETESATEIAKIEVPGLNLGQESITHLLEELRAVRQAEQELHETQKSE